MTEEDKIILKRVDAYKEEALKDIDPMKARPGVQIQLLTPILKAIAAEKGISLDDMFVKYMDLEMEYKTEKGQRFRNDFPEDLGSIPFDPKNF